MQTRSSLKSCPVPHTLPLHLQLLWLLGAALTQCLMETLQMSLYPASLLPSSPSVSGLPRNRG
jgi:hypothetical protein